MEDQVGKGSVRLDKWLWVARFFKTRSLASAEIGKGRVQVNGQTAKPSREVRIGDTLEIRQGGTARSVLVSGLSALRGPAPVAVPHRHTDGQLHGVATYSPCRPFPAAGHGQLPAIASSRCRA